MIETQRVRVMKLQVGDVFHDEKLNLFGEITEIDWYYLRSMIRIQYIDNNGKEASYHTIKAGKYTIAKREI